MDSEMIEQKLKQMSIQPLEQIATANEHLSSNLGKGLQGKALFSENVFHHPTAESLPVSRCK